jgi:hypothetical protein
MPSKPRIVYCHCAYARVVPPAVKSAVLGNLCASDNAFEAVADLCEMSARRDPALKRLASAGPLKIAACYPRAVKWLFSAAGADLDPTQTEILNQRDQEAEAIIESLSSDEISPNVPTDQENDNSKTTKTEDKP